MLISRQKRNQFERNRCRSFWSSFESEWKRRKRMSPHRSKRPQQNRARPPLPSQWRQLSIPKLAPSQITKTIFGSGLRTKVTLANLLMVFFRERIYIDSKHLDSQLVVPRRSSNHCSRLTRPLEQRISTRSQFVSVGLKNYVDFIINNVKGYLFFDFYIW